MMNWKRLSSNVKIVPLGQVGYLFECDGTVIAIDPYLTDAVAEKHGPTFHRQIPAPIASEDLPAVAALLLTHAHDDHTDPGSIEMIAATNSDLRVFAPKPVRRTLRDATNLSPELLADAFGDWVKLSANVSILQVPAAHPEPVEFEDGTWAASGFLLQCGETTIYHAGDTSVHEVVIDAVRRSNVRLDFAFLPVNENNYFRTKDGIVGNMTVREAFGLAETISAKTLVPTHWDLFAGNGLYREELDLLYRNLQPPFTVRWFPVEDRGEDQ